MRTHVRYAIVVPRKIYNWTTIQQYHDQGHTFVECQKRFGFTHTAWVKAIKRGQLNAGPREFADRRRRYDWAQIQAYYDEGHTYGECREKFGFNPMSWHKAKKRGEIRSRPRAPQLDVLLRTSRSRYSVKRRLLNEGILKNQCDECGISEWRGKPLSIQVDHINGISNDHRIENLRMLCPNCHSQTDTFAARNRQRKRGGLQGTTGDV